MDANKIINRYNSAIKQKSNWSSLYEEALEYAAPHREVFNQEAPGQDKTGRGIVFDSTASDALGKLVSNLQASMVPPMKRFVRFTPGFEVAKEGKDEIQEQLDEIRDRFFEVLQNSNFDHQVTEAFTDLALGTGSIMAQKDPNRQGLVFTAVPISQLAIEEGAHHTIDTQYRAHKILPRNIEKTWPDAELSESIKEAVAFDSNKKVTLIEATMPAEIEVFDKRTEKRIKQQGFKYFVVSQKDQKVLVERQHRTSPWIVFRWSVLPGETYGRGPLLQALPDIKTLNKTKELLLQSASIGIFGMYTATDDGVLNVNNIRFQSGAIIPVESNGGARGESLKPLPTNTRVDLSQIIIDDMQTSINSMMFADPIGPVDAPVKTATEISVRQAELSKRIGSSFGRLQFEFIRPLVNRVLDLMDEMGIIDLGPFRVDGNVIDIQHVSPLAMAQDEEDLTNVIRYAELMNNLFGPQVALGLMKPDVIAKDVSEKLAIPSNVVPSEAEFAQMKEALKQSATDAETENPGAAASQLAG